MRHLQKTNKLQHTKSPACCFKAVTKQQNGRGKKKVGLIGVARNTAAATQRKLRPRGETAAEINTFYRFGWN